MATFRSVTGKDCLQVFLNLNFGDEEIKITSSLSALEEYFLPKRNIVYERYVFNSCIQTPEETVDGYVNRLRKLASSCQFGTLTEEMIRNRLVIAIHDTGTKARLLREKDLSLDKALDMCKSSEITNKQIKSPQHESKQLNEELHPVQDKSKTKIKKPRSSNPNKTTKGSKKTWKCKFCGQAKWHSKPTDCPAYGQQCRFCKKMNHFSKVCLSRKDSHGTVHFAEEAKVEDYDSEESILTIEEISAIKGHGKQMTSSITFLVDGDEKVPLICQLDTGSTCNVISYTDVGQLLQDGNPPLDMTKSKLKLFDGTFIQPVGVTTLTVERRGKHYDLQFQVVESTNKPLLSAETCAQLGLLKVERDSYEKVHSLESKTLTREQIMANYRDVFEGLGHIGDTAIVTDPLVKPTQHSPR